VLRQGAAGTRDHTAKGVRRSWEMEASKVLRRLSRSASRRAVSAVSASCARSSARPIWLANVSSRCRCSGKSTRRGLEGSTANTPSGSSLSRSDVNGVHSTPRDRKVLARSNVSRHEGHRRAWDLRLDAGFDRSVAEGIPRSASGATRESGAPRSFACDGLLRFKKKTAVAIQRLPPEARVLLCSIARIPHERARGGT
jgi:hypothetical protein